jgi:hypothetical protein
MKVFQRETWHRLVGLFTFESYTMDDQIELLLKIGNYCAFLKDSSFH